jgi:hypothetical protein
VRICALELDGVLLCADLLCSQFLFGATARTNHSCIPLVQTWMIGIAEDETMTTLQT